MKNEYEKCVFCEKEVTDDNIRLFDNTLMCPDCLENETVICKECSKRIWKEDAEGGDIVLCSYCHDNRYTYCHDCNALICNDNVYFHNNEDDIPYCEECFERNEHGEIKSYNYKPEPIFYGSGLFLGIELEIDGGGECNDNARVLLNVANVNGEKLYIKHDGSIDDGFELVTHPMDLKNHTTVMPWRDILSKAVSLGYRSHQTNTCGLHIHCDRKTLGKTQLEQEEVIARIVYFVEAHWNELHCFSRRTEKQISRWTNRFGLKDTPEQDAKGRHSRRYVCVNVENYATIEIRIFRGTLRYETLMASIQLTDEICHMAMSMSDEEFQSMSWSDFVSKVSDDNKELIDYLKTKRLYINESVETEEET